MTDYSLDTHNVSTIGIRGAEHRGFEGEHSMAIYPTSSYAFDSAEDAAARFTGDNSGNIYSRFSNPSVDAFAKRLAAMEGGATAVATASGMSAILSLCLANLSAGDHIVAANTLFGSSIGLFNNHLSRLGINISYVDPDEPQNWAKAITAQTKMFFAETPSNPLTRIVDIAAVAEIARKHHILFVVDNCFCTPILQKPLSLGADVVVHSATKFIDGQGRLLGGAVVGDEDVVGEKTFKFLRSAGTTLSAFNAWVFYKSLETLKVRMQAHCTSAQQLAEWLEQQDAVEKVYYPGLQSHAQHALATKQQPGGYGAVVTLRVKGGQAGAYKLINNTQMLTITNNLGDTRTTIVHPATTTHYRIGAEARAKAGVADGVVRLSVGLEDLEDIKADLAPGLGL